MDAHGAAGARTLDVCRDLEPRPHPLVLAMASPRRDCVVGQRSDRPHRFAFTLRVRLLAGAGGYISDQSFRFVRPASGVAVPAREAVHEAPVRNAGTLPSRAASSLCRLVLRLLDDADDDIRAS